MNRQAPSEHSHLDCAANGHPACSFYIGAICHLFGKVLTVSAQFKAAKHKGVVFRIRESPAPEFRIVGTLSPQFKAILVLIPGGAA